MSSNFMEELNNRVKSSDHGRQFVLPKNINKIPDASISKKSNKSEVRKWLKSLNFNEVTIESLGDLTGAQIFTLTKDELRQICDDEGNLVYSKLQIQKNLNSTISSKELISVLGMRKEKIEGNMEQF